MAEDVLHKKQESELTELVRIQGYKIDALSLQLNRMADQLAQMKTPPSLMPSAMVTMMTASAPAPAPLAAKVTGTTLKNVMISPPVLAKPVLLPEPEVVEEEVDDAEVEEEEEAEEEVEEEAMELEEFTYKGKTYAKDGENQVYQLNSEGELEDDTPIGIWNEKTKRIHPI
jgi:hypothetical protein